MRVTGSFAPNRVADYSKGLRSWTPTPCMSRILRVTKVMPNLNAVAAICISSGERAFPSRIVRPTIRPTPRLCPCRIERCDGRNWKRRNYTTLQGSASAHLHRPAFLSPCEARRSSPMKRKDRPPQRTQSNEGPIQKAASSQVPKRRKYQAGTSFRIFRSEPTRALEVGRLV